MATSEKSLAAPDSRVTESSPEKHTLSEEEEDGEEEEVVSHCPFLEVPLSAVQFVEMGAATQSEQSVEAGHMFMST
jgi:hypothetical protein